MNKEFQPVSIEVSNSDQVLEITWGDGHISKYPLFGLRKNCPCVMCRGGHDQMNRFDETLFDVEPTRRFEIKKLDPIGNHALQISWDDGHNSGMYRWELLRSFR
jgi:DUF971 family protein